MPKFSIIVAADLNNGIGFQNTIPWNIPSELKYFREVTHGAGKNAVIMGRNTWESLPPSSRPLKNRLNIVVTRQSDLDLPSEVLLASSLDEALAKAGTDKDEVFVIGGAQLYALAINHPACNKIYITRVQDTFEADTFFPNIDRNKFEQFDASEPQEENGFQFQFQVWTTI